MAVVARTKSFRACILPSGAGVVQTIAYTNPNVGRKRQAHSKRDGVGRDDVRTSHTHQGEGRDARGTSHSSVTGIAQAARSGRSSSRDRLQSRMRPHHS